MFTVLVKKPNGHEDLYACDSFHKEPHAVLMRGDSLNQGVEVLGPEGQTMSLDWEREGSGGLREGKTASIYVMNSHGKTIATYSL